VIAEHFGLAMLPFGQRPDTRVFHKLLQHQLAYSLILKAIKSPSAKIALSAPEGAGKTLFLRILRNAFANITGAAPPLFVCNKDISSGALVDDLLTQLRSPATTDLSYHTKLESIAQQLQTLGHRIIILVDDLDCMHAELLTVIKRVIEFVSGSDQQVALIYSIKNFNLNLSSHDGFFTPTTTTSLNYLDEHSTGKYLDFRIRKAGYSGTGLFSIEAVSRLFNNTSGNPRSINTLANQALFVAADSGDNMIRAEHIDRAIRRDDSESPIW
jgi:MSHA biogenesis protein MshM